MASPGDLSALKISNQASSPICNAIEFTKLPCANNSGSNSNFKFEDCKNEGDKVCAGCHLVAYCSKDCQKRHWQLHKRDCKADMTKKTWEPSFARECRMPAFSKSMQLVSTPFTHLGDNMRNFWGQYPAYDSLNLTENEGLDHAGDLAVCFALSADLRNVFETISTLHKSYKGQLTIMLNDEEEGRVFHSFLVLLLLDIEDVDLAVDTMIHLWYSARLKPAHVSALKKYIRPRIAGMVEKTQYRLNDKLLSKAFTVGNSSVRIALDKCQWEKLLSILDRKLDVGKTEKNRNPAKVLFEDYFEIRAYCFRRHRHCRVSAGQFRSRGVLLPFGMSDKEFTLANPTFFSRNNEFLGVQTTDDPLYGWCRSKVSSMSSSRTPKLKCDLYGNLYFFLQGRLREVHGKIRTMPINFSMTQVPITVLPSLDLGHLYDRIDTTTIVDNYQVELGVALQTAQQLLNPKNKYATLITFHNNLAPLTVPFGQQESARQMHKYMPKAMHFLGNDFLPTIPYDPKCFFAIRASTYFHPYETLFSDYIQGELSDIALTQMSIKENNTIVQKWPFKLTKEYGEEGAQDDFEELTESQVSGGERYAEWQLAKT